MSNVSFAPRFSATNMTLKGMTMNASPAVEAPVQTGFRTRYNTSDKLSAVTTVAGVSFNETTREILALGEDGRVRRCKIDRMPSLQDARNLWQQLVIAHNNDRPVQFVAAGGFSPDSWFYALK